MGNPISSKREEEQGYTKPRVDTSSGQKQLIIFYRRTSSRHILSVQLSNIDAFVCKNMRDHDQEIRVAMEVLNSVALVLVAFED